MIGKMKKAKIAERDLDEERLARLERRGAIRRGTGDFGESLELISRSKFPEVRAS